MHREHILRQIESDSGNLRRERSPTSPLADPSCHTDAVRCGYIIRLNRPGCTNIQRPKIEPVATNPVDLPGFCGERLAQFPALSLEGDGALEAER